MKIEPNRKEIKEMRIKKIKQILCDSTDDDILYAIGLGVLELIESEK